MLPQLFQLGPFHLSSLGALLLGLFLLLVALAAFLSLLKHISKGKGWDAFRMIAELVLFAPSAFFGIRLLLNPQPLEVGSFGVPTYGLMAALGLIVGLSISVRLARRQGIDPDLAWNLGIYAILSGILGAKILFVVQEWSYYSSNPGAILSFATLQAGGIWYGGLIGALLVSIWYVRHHRLPALKTCDAFAPGVALGHAFGRLGCFAAGCCYGKHTDLPWGVIFTNPIANQVVGTPLGIALHPTQIYEFLVELGNFFILLWLFRHKKFDGQVIGAYLFLYGFARYFLEFLRDDPGRGTVFGGAMSGSQFISILMVIVGGVLWIRRAPAPAVADAAR